MRSGSQAKSRIAKSARIERRRLADRERILKAAAARFGEAGPEHVRLDEIATLADVARGTLYSHFASKEELTLELMRPVLQDALARLEDAERARTARDRISALLEVYLSLWADHADALRLSHRLMQARDPTAAAQLHMAFVGRVVALMAKVARAGILRASPELAARTLAYVAVPLLELYASQPGGAVLFVDAVRGLLLKDEAP